jgi:hypothetical protein
MGARGRRLGMLRMPRIAQLDDDQHVPHELGLSSLRPAASAS